MNSQAMFVEANKDESLAVYDPFRAQLAELKTLNASVVFNYEDSAGNKEARSHIYKLRRTKTAVDEARKTAGKDALEYKRKVDAQGNAIISEIEAMIQVHLVPIEAIEQRERERVARLETGLREIVDAGAISLECWQKLPLQAMKDRLVELEAQVIDPVHWAEFTEEASAAREKSIGQLREAITMREKFDAEQAELAELRRQKAERDQKARDEEIARKAAEDAKRQSEEDARLKAEAAKKRELDLQQQLEKANREAAQAAANMQKAIEESHRKSEQERIARESNRHHLAKVNNEIVDAVCVLGATKDFAMLLVAEMARGNVPHVKINY